MSQYDLIYNKVSEMICDAKDLDAGTFTPESMLAELELDSLDYVELMVLAKREFNITLRPETFIQNPLMTLNELCQHIAQEVAA